jgi:acyl-CoA thioester hydrolase
MIMSDWDYDAPHILEIAVSKNDIDGLGHVNNVSYVRWCEDIGWQHSVTLGISVDDFQRLQRGMAINRAEYEYLAPCFADEQLLLGTWITASDNRLRMERSFQLRNSATGKTVFRARWQLMSLNLANGKAVRMPPEFISRYGPAVVTRAEHTAD